MDIDEGDAGPCLALDDRALPIASAGCISLYAYVDVPPMAQERSLKEMCGWERASESVGSGAWRRSPGEPDENRSLRAALNHHGVSEQHSMCQFVKDQQRAPHSLLPS